MAFINSNSYHVGMVGRGGAFEIEGGLDCTTYTQSGTDYRACTFTSSGSFTVIGDGYIDVMVVSGGGGAGSSGGSPEGGFFGSAVLAWPRHIGDSKFQSVIHPSLRMHPLGNGCGKYYEKSGHVRSRDTSEQIGVKS